MLKLKWNKPGFFKRWWSWKKYYDKQNFNRQIFWSTTLTLILAFIFLFIIVLINVMILKSQTYSTTDYEINKIYLETFKVR